MVNDRMFSYTYQKEWCGECNYCDEQSPININLKNLKCCPMLPCRFINYCKKLENWSVNNNGYTVLLTCDELNQFCAKDYNFDNIDAYCNDFTGGVDCSECHLLECTERDPNLECNECDHPGIRSGPLDSPTNLYKFVHIQFHWGRNDECGSEHTINCKRFPLEMQIVHYNEKYNNLWEATTKKDGVAILVFFFELSDYNSLLSKILNCVLPSIKKKGTYVQLPYELSLKDLIEGVDLSNFITYRGSITVPPCTPARYVIFRQMKTVTRETMKKFRKILPTNFRDLQPVGKRNVYVKT